MYVWKKCNYSYVVQNIYILICNRHIIINLESVFAVMLYLFLNCENLKYLPILLHLSYKHITNPSFLLLLEFLSFFILKRRLVDSSSRNYKLPGQCAIIKTPTSVAQLRIEFSFLPNVF